MSATGIRGSGDRGAAQNDGVLIGRGGFSAVTLRRIGNGAFVAVKRLLLPMTESRPRNGRTGEEGELKRAFAGERRLLRWLSAPQRAHPHVVRAVDASSFGYQKNGGEEYADDELIMMEWCQRGNVWDFLDGRRRQPRRRQLPTNADADADSGPLTPDECEVRSL